MKLELLHILRCPFCGDRLSLGKDAFARIEADEVLTGILLCQCCAFPVVAGIPYLRTGAAAASAMRLLGEGRAEEALFLLLDLDGERRAAFAGLLATGERATFRQALDVLSRDAEGAYLLHRFSDPTYLCSQALLGALGQDSRCVARPLLDLCGGAGHLTRVLAGLPGAGPVVLADLTFWKLWLASRFVAPACRPACCDANQPLPFARSTFSLVVCSDAFHYVWARRLLADEMLRLIGDAGVVALPHLHNALVPDYSAGMPLTPAGYRQLFDTCETRLFKESDLLPRLLAEHSLDLAGNLEDGELADEQALVLLASRLDGIFRLYGLPADVETAGVLEVNPLYEEERADGRVRLRLRFPSEGYALEFEGSRRYLPPQVELESSLLARLRAGRLDPELAALRERRVLLDLPHGYL